LILALSSHYFVCAPDMPGCGESEPFFMTELPGIADYADAMMTFCAQQHLASPVVYGIGFGSAVAIAMAARGLAESLILRGVWLGDAAEKADMLNKFAPRINIEADGSHWYRTWLMLRDSQVYWPWYAQRASALRRIPADFSADHMHRWTFEVMKQLGSYHHLLHAALQFDAKAALQNCKMAIIICNDPGVPLSIYDSRLTQLLPDATHFDFADAEEHVRFIAKHCSA
jgi:pimeloyl-ACP methyl ester carboxylesterase